jgi:pyruvate dehydrogenase E2 component (dihydrolipoamide acetyltransferase)
MPTVIMPKMGDAMEEGTLLKWLKDVGEEVEVGDPLAEIETDKVTLEIEAEAAGTLTQRLADEGDSIPVGNPIATIGAADEVAAAPAPAAAAPAAQAAAPAAQAAEGRAAGDRETSIESGVGTPATAEAGAREPAAARGAPTAAATNGRGQVRDSVAADGAAVPAPIERATGDRLRASPLVKRLAAEHGIDLHAIAGSGPGGRIVKDDIMPYVTGAKSKPAVAEAVGRTGGEAETIAPPSVPSQIPPPPPAPLSGPTAPPPSGRPAGVVHELSRIRKTTGKRMAESKQRAPHFYVSVEVDMGAAVAFRQEINEQAPDDASKVSFNDLVVKAAALALREFPNLNTSFDGEMLTEHPNIDVNIAVAIEGGLIAPFVPDADQKSLGTIARLAKDLIKRAREGGLQPHEYQGGTFTISNLGMFDVEEFVAVINPPQAAILAIASIREVPVVRDGEVTVGHRMKLTLSADHRVTDGAEVARFLQAVRRYLERPMLLALS